MTLPARPRTLTPAPPPAPLPRATIIAAPAPGSAHAVVKLDGDPGQVYARVVEGAGISAVPGTRVRLELVGRDLTIIRGA